MVASGIGDPLHTEKSRLDPYHFGDTKVKVEIELSKTPPEVVEVRDTQGNSVRINVEYPSLLPKCINCGKYGHLMNRCHKAQMKKTQYPIQTQKKEKVISVVKAKEDVSLAEVTKENVSLQKGEMSQEAKSRQRSRSRKRSRSKAKARARALSSPPEVLSQVVPPVLESKSVEVLMLESDKQVSPVAIESMKSDTVAVSGKERIQLEEGEIGEEEVVVSEQLKKRFLEESLSNKEVEEPVWFTKHSKNYRRAVRQLELWKSMGAVGSPPKSSKFLLQGNSLGGNLEA